MSCDGEVQVPWENVEACLTQTLEPQGTEIFTGVSSTHGTHRKATATESTEVLWEVQGSGISHTIWIYTFPKDRACPWWGYLLPECGRVENTLRGQAVALSFTSATLHKSNSLLESQFPHLYNGGHSADIIGAPERLGPCAAPWSVIPSSV